MTESIQRIVGVFVVGFLPLVVVIPILEMVDHEAVDVASGLGILAWLIYVNVWSKRAFSIYNSEPIKLWDAWSKSKVFLNTDILSKLAFLPVIGVLMDNWIYRNNPHGQDDRENKLNMKKDKK